MYERGVRGEICDPGTARPGGEARAGPYGEGELATAPRGADVSRPPSRDGWWPRRACLAALAPRIAAGRRRPWRRPPTIHPPSSWSPKSDASRWSRSSPRAAAGSPSPLPRCRPTYRRIQGADDARRRDCRSLRSPPPLAFDLPLLDAAKGPLGQLRLSFSVALLTHDVGWGSFCHPLAARMNVAGDHCKECELEALRSVSRRASSVRSRPVCRIRGGDR